MESMMRNAMGIIVSLLIASGLLIQANVYADEQDRLQQTQLALEADLEYLSLVLDPTPGSTLKTVIKSIQDEYVKTYRVELPQLKKEHLETLAKVIDSEITKLYTERGGLMAGVYFPAIMSALTADEISTWAEAHRQGQRAAVVKAFGVEKLSALETGLNQQVAQHNRQLLAPINDILSERIYSDVFVPAGIQFEADEGDTH